jgi:uncharacterized protein (TIGR04222 family)
MLGIFACGIPLVLGSLNPLDMRGPAFLMLYVSLVALAIGGALLVRNWLLSWDDPAVVDADKPLDCYEVACLANGPARIVDAAASNLVAAGHLRLVEEPKGLLRAASVRLHQGEPLPHDAPDIELALYCAAGTPVDNLLKLRKPADDATSAIESNLIHRGLVRAKSWLGFAQLVPALLAASPLVIGIPKVLIGQQRDKPVGFLILLCVVTAGIAVAFLMWRKYRTSAGDRLLSEYTEQYRAVREANASDTTTAGAGQMGMLVGLFGAAILVGSPFSPLQTMMTRASGGTGCSSSGCTTSSGCGGDSGGGCGGGGCGGCGGD